MASGQDDPIELGPGSRTPRHVNRAVRAAQVNGEENSIQVAHFTSDGQVASHPIPPAQLGRAATDYSSIDQDMNNNIPNAPQLVHDGLASSIHAPTTDTTTQLKGVALDDKSPHTTAEPMSIRQTIVTINGKPISDVTSATRTKTGWTLRPRTREAHLAILNAAAIIGSHLGSKRIDEATKWYTYVIPRCPRSYMDCVTNTKHYTTDILKEEVERATGLTPIRTAASRRNDHESPTYNASRIIDKPAAIPQYTNCWDFHPRRNCDRTPRCIICGKGEHNGACTTAPQCANCLGPHPAGEPSCLMRPRRQNGKMVKPSRAERGRLRERGNQASRRANPPAPPSSPTIPPRSFPLGDRARSPMQPPPQLPTTATRPTKTRNLAPGKPKKTVRVFQANVNKDWAAHSTALALARKGGYTVVMLQEPWTSTKDSYTVTHKAYPLYSPVPYWHETLTRPRVVTYTRDMLWVKAGKTTFVNIYRQAGDTQKMRILETWPIPADCVVLGDFNSRHPFWQAGRIAGVGSELHRWSEDTKMTLLNTPNEPTNDFGNTIDLAFSNNPTAVANIEDHLATTADHYTLSITLGTENRKAINPAKRKVDDIARFEQIIAHQAQHLYKPPGTPIHAYCTLIPRISTMASSSPIDSTSAQLTTIERLGWDFYSFFRVEYPEKNKTQIGRFRKSHGLREYVCLHSSTHWSNGYTSNAITHAQNRHRQLIQASETSQNSQQSTQPPIDSYITFQPSDSALRNVFNAQRYIEAFVGLLTGVESHSLQLHCLITSRDQAMKIINANYGLYASQLRDLIRGSQSMIHISTNLWTSPHRHAMLAALLGLPECPFSHSGEAQAALIVEVLRNFDILRVGYYTGDNATSNNTCLEVNWILSDIEWIDFNPKRRRIRCIGHIINLSLQSFLLARSKEALAVALDATTSDESVDMVDHFAATLAETISQQEEPVLQSKRPKSTAKASQKTGIDEDYTGWQGIPALQKLHNLAVWLRSLSLHSDSWRNAVGLSLGIDNTIRWSSWYKV
ncbi:unnamed protein product [Fusarium equiseti]|uniref:Endonuclease/exonuclease/phosphatase domain-containing protein n=1 Tax=Fusarium equiseti TaxID=61235 RepID=A0A8J2J6V8_FUSEQ|nr:unnamed protein product [Fusarium equiseti]